MRPARAPLPFSTLPVMPPIDDPVRARRAHIAHAVAIGKRVGYFALLAAIIGFVAVLVTEYAAWAVWTTGIALVVACVVLPMPIMFGYMVRAAEREDR